MVACIMEYSEINTVEFIKIHDRVDPDIDMPPNAYHVFSHRVPVGRGDLHDDDLDRYT